MSKMHNKERYSGILDWFRPGIKEGLGKMRLYHLLGALLMFSEAPHRDDAAIQKISDTARRVGIHANHAASFQGSPSQAVKRYANKAAAIVGENATVFGSAAAGGVTFGPVGAVVGTAATTGTQNYGQSIAHEFKRAGHDLKASEQVRAALADPAFLKDTRRAAQIDALHMTGAVLSAGALAGYFYNVVAEPLASAGTAMLRSTFARTFTDVVAKGLKSVVNSASRKALEAVPMRNLIVPAFVVATSSAPIVENTHYERDVTQGRPSYYSAALYL